MVLFRKHLNKQKQLVYFCLGLKLVWQILSSLRAEATFYLVKSLSPYPCPHHLAIYSTQQALSIQYKHWKYVSLWMIQKIFSDLCKVDFDCLTLITDFFFFSFVYMLLGQTFLGLWVFIMFISLIILTPFYVH